MSTNNGRSCIPYWHILSAVVDEHNTAHKNHHGRNHMPLSHFDYGKWIYWWNRLIIIEKDNLYINILVCHKVARTLYSSHIQFDWNYISFLYLW